MLTRSTDDANGTHRTIQTFDDGLRRVILQHRESWSSYMIIPRSLLVAGIRRRRARGAQFHDCDWWTLIDCSQWTSPAGNGGPGRAFASEPQCYRRGRRFVVIAQRGGLDV